MRNRIQIGALCICILFMAGGCGSDTECGESSVQSMESPDATEDDWVEQTEFGNLEEGISDIGYSSVMSLSEGDTEVGNEESSEEGAELSEESAELSDTMESGRGEQAKLHKTYEELITAAKECIEGKADADSDDYDFSYMIYWYGAYYGASMRLGYLMEDLDGNGTEELIFGQNDDPDSAWNGVIYNLFTIEDGEVIRVFNGGERATYHLCENGMIAHEGADGAFRSVYAYYSFEGTELHLVEAVIYNGWDYEENPWFYSTRTDSYYDEEYLEPISEEQAWSIIEKYVYEHPTFIPFVEE